MSHLTTYESNSLVNVKKSLLIKALKDLDLEINFDLKQVHNTFIRESVDAVLVKNGKPISVGFKLIREGKDIKLQLAGDFYRTGLNESALIDNISQMYKKHHIVEQCKQQGWSVTSKDINLDSKTDEVVITATKLAI